MSYTTYLAHHGIKGQKWGVRRFQKADGSLTAAGAKRYGIGSVKDAGRKVGSGIVKGAKAAVQKAKEHKAKKAAEKLERQKQVWAKTRLGLSTHADKFTIDELREANDRLDQRDRAAKGFAEQIQRGVGYFKAIRDVTGAIKDTKDYLEDITGETERKKKAEEDLKYERQLAKEERDHQRNLERDKASAERDIEYKREKDRLDRESRESINKYTVDAENKKDDDGSSASSAKPKGPDDDGGGSGNTIKLNGKTYDADFMKKTNPEAYEYAMKKQKEEAHNARLDYLDERTKKSDTSKGQESSRKEASSSSDKNQNEGDNHINQHRVDRYKEFASNIDASDLSPDDKVKFKKSFYSKVKSLGGDNEDFNLETERSLDIAKGLKNAAEKRKATEARQKAEAEANREETTAERQKRKVEEAKAYGAEAQYQANKAQLDSMSDSQLAKMAFQRKKSEVIDAVKSFNPKAMAEKYLASSEREKLEKESKKIAELSVENLGSRYAEMVRRNGQEAADYAMTEYTESMRRQVESSSRDKAFVGKTYTPDSKRMEKDRTALNNKKTRDQIDTNVKEIDTLRKKAENLDRIRGEGGGDQYWNQIAKLEEENRKLRNTINHSAISAYGNYLAHHGVKGMKWGHRKAMANTGSISAKSIKFEGRGGGGGEPIDEEDPERPEFIDKYISDVKKNPKSELHEALASPLAAYYLAADVYKIYKSFKEQKAEVDRRRNNRPVGRKVNVTGTGKGVQKREKVEPKKHQLTQNGSKSGKQKVGNKMKHHRITSHTTSKAEKVKLGDKVKHDIFTYDVYLAHHGIKGQKWGIRRFQNEDGTLTKAGMKRAGYKFKTLRKNATASRVLIDENEDTLNLDRAYFSTNNLDNQKWANYFASIGAQHLDKSAFAVNFRTKKKLLIARGEEISKVASKLMAEDDTFRKEFEATRQKQIRSTGSDEAWESLSESAKYSAMIAYKCEGGKKIVNAMKEIGFDGVEDLFGKDVSKDPIIIFDPGSNLRQVGKKQELKGLYRGYRQYYGLPINHSSFSLHSISDSMPTFADDDLSAYGTYLAHHGIKGQKWGVRRFQNYDGTRISSRIRSGIQARRYSAELNKLERKKKKSVDRMLQEYNKIRGLMNEAKKYSITKPMRALKLLDKGEARLDKFARMQAEDEKFEDEIIKKQKVILSELKKNGFEYTAPAYRVKVGSDKSIRFA